MKIIIFTVSTGLDLTGPELQKKVNDWLENNPAARIQYVIQSESCFCGTGKSITLTIFYT